MNTKIVYGNKIIFNLFTSLSSNLIVNHLDFSEEFYLWVYSNTVEIFSQ